MINLLPPGRVLNIRLARSNTILRRYVELIIVGSLVLLAAILVARYFFGVQNDNIQRTVDLNNAKIASLQPVQKQAEELSATVNTISGLLSRNVKFSDMLTQIGGIMPPGSVLTGLKFSPRFLTVRSTMNRRRPCCEITWLLLVFLKKLN